LWLHYESGPCKDRLGIPRAQINKYRLTAILTMAGIGLLILIASPAIIIAAPCLLCYKFAPRDEDGKSDDLAGSTLSEDGSEKGDAADGDDSSVKQADDSVEKQRPSPSPSAASGSRTQNGNSNGDSSCRQQREPVFPFCRIL